MESRFHRELEDLKATILDMAALTLKAMEKSLRALFDRNEQLAEEVIEKDQEVNLLEVQVDRLILKLLALAQPMARDLRFIIGCMRTSVDLERIGDQAVNVAQRAQYLNSRPPLPSIPAMVELADTAMDMLRVAISAFTNLNVSQAMDVCQMDDEADELNVQVLKILWIIWSTILRRSSVPSRPSLPLGASNGWRTTVPTSPRACSSSPGGSTSSIIVNNDHGLSKTPITAVLLWNAKESLSTPAIWPMVHAPSIGCRS